MSDHLPLHLIATILSRLPVKSLLPLRCVSKSWSSLIDSQEFNRLHLKESIETTSNLYLTVNGPDYQVYSIEFDKLDKANEIKNPFGECTVLGSCNGILLLVDLGRRRSKKMALFNPATRTHQVLPNAPLPNYSGSLNKSYRESFGFGCDSVKNDFKVVSLIKFDSICETRIFSLKMNSWKKIKDFPYALSKKRAWGVQVKGALHTLVDQSSNSSGTKMIVALDLAEEEYRSMEIPDVGSEKVSEFVLAKLGECLTLSVYKGVITDIWVMKEYGVVGSWTKLLSAEIGAQLRTLSFSKAGNKLLLYLGHNHFVWYDLQRKTLLHVPVSGLPRYFYCNLCAENLLRLDESTKNQNGQGTMTEIEKNKERDNLLAVRFILNL